jgi:nitrogen fixation NifU-like protein
MRELYTQVIMDHYQHPRNRGELEDADLREHLLNPLCGDEVTVYAVIDGDNVQNVKFEGRGCSISQASASMMTERLVGKSRAEAEKEIQSFRAMMVGESIKCATLAWAAFEQGLEGRKG